MSEQEFYIELAAGLTVYQPIKRDAEVVELTDWREWYAAQRNAA